MSETPLYESNISFFRAILDENHANEMINLKSQLCEVVPLSRELEHIRQSCPESGHRLQVNQVTTFKLSPFR